MLSIYDLRFFSSTFATSNIFSSHNLGQRICNQTGNSISSQSSGLVYQIGSVNQGSCARLQFTVNISDKYILSGSSTFSQIFHATVGAVGVIIISTFLNASVKSFLISSLTSEAFL